MDLAIQRCPRVFFPPDPFKSQPQRFAIYKPALSWCLWEISHVWLGSVLSSVREEGAVLVCTGSSVPQQGHLRWHPLHSSYRELLFLLNEWINKQINHADFSVIYKSAVTQRAGEAPRFAVPWRAGEASCSPYPALAGLWTSSQWHLWVMDGGLALLQQGWEHSLGCALPQCRIMPNKLN